MQRLLLSKEVKINDFNLFGRPAFIYLTPCSEPGWYWDIGTDLVPINQSLVQLRKNRIVLQYRGNTLNIAEHILSLRWTGLDGVIVKASSWPPYFGGMMKLWQAIQLNLLETDQQVPWLKIAKEKSINIDGRSVRCASSNVSGLKIKITADFPRFGRLTKRFKLPDESLADYFTARPLATNSESNFWPTLSRMVEKTGLWPHHQHLAWPTEQSSQELLEELANHRLLDLLGALAMVDHYRLPAGRIISIKGGHALDVHLINTIRR